MKKSVLLKILLTFVMLTLIISLVACKPKVPTPDPEPEGPTAMEQLVGIIRGADGLIKVLNGAEDNLNADVAISVNRKKGDTTNKYALGVKGNINASSPELAVNFLDKDVEKLALGYKSNKLYLKQPLTSINKNPDGTNAEAPEAMSADISALSSSVGNLMAVVMDALKGVNIKLDLDKMATEIERIIGSMDLSTLIVFKQLENGDRLELTAGTINLARTAFLNKLLQGVVGTVADTAINMLFDTSDGINYLYNSDIYVEVYKGSDKVINGIKIGFTAKDNSTGDIFIDLKKFNNTTDKATVAFGSEYTAKSLNLGLALGLPQKGVTAGLDATVTPDFSAAGKILGAANLSFVDLMDGQAAPYVVPAYFNGTTGYFDTAAMYNGLNAIAGTNIITAPASTLYSASIYEKNTDGSVKNNKSLINTINDAVAKSKTEYFANKDKPKEEAGPSKGIINTIYEMLGGKLSLQTDKDGKQEYKATTEAEMLQQLDNKFGDYTRFEIYKSKSTETYEKAINNITDLFDANKAWIIGTETDHNAGNYGIFEWDKENWRGGATLYKSGEKNDLLDAVNVFLCNGKTGTTPNNVTTATISEFVNYYVSMLHYFTTDDVSYIDKVELADKTLLIAKNIFQAADKSTDVKKDAAKAALTTAKNVYKTAMEKAIFGEGQTKIFTIANNLINQILGTNIATDNVLDTIINGGVYVGVGSIKGQGINGYLTVANNNTEEATVYITLAGRLALTATAAAANIESTEGAVELASGYVLVLGGEEDFDFNKYKKVATWEDGTKKVVTSGENAGSYIYELKNGNVVYNNRNANAEDILDQLKAMYEAYLVAR